MAEELFGNFYMICGEVGLNHLGNVQYANNYIKFHFKNNFDSLSFQIRELSFYERHEKKHLKLPYSFYSEISKKYSSIKEKKIGLSVSNLNSINKLINLNFDFYKILSIAAKDENLIKTILKKTKANIYISLGSLNKIEINKLINKYIKNSRVKFNYTQLSYNKHNLNLENLLYYQRKYKEKFAYGHHYINDLPIILTSAVYNCDLFIYLKGNKENKHPDEKHAYNFINFIRLLIKIDESKKLLGKKGNFFSKNDIPDQSNS